MWQATSEADLYVADEISSMQVSAEPLPHGFHEKRPCGGLKARIRMVIPCGVVLQYM